MRHRINWPAIHEWAQFYGKSIVEAYRIMLNCPYFKPVPLYGRGYVWPWWSDQYRAQRMLRANRALVRPLIRWETRYIYDPLMRINERVDRWRDRIGIGRA